MQSPSYSPQHSVSRCEAGKVNHRVTETFNYKLNFPTMEVDKRVTEMFNYYAKLKDSMKLW